MQVHHLLENNSIANNFISQLRDTAIQTDRMRFRRNIERLGEILGYELSKTFDFKEKEITTPLGKAKLNIPAEEVVLCSILRAGLPLHTGLLNYFDSADNSFISAYRHHPNDDEEFEILVEYLASPSLEGKTLVLADPMLATGRSMTLAIKAIVEQLGNPDHIHIAAVIASEEGLEYLRARKPSNASIWVGAVDPELNAKAYIVPGLGDAGDLAFGSKV